MAKMHGEPADLPTVPYASIKSFAAGAISGAISKTAVAPFDRYVSLILHISVSLQEESLTYSFFFWIKNYALSPVLVLET